MVIGFALEDERITDTFRHACEQAYYDIDYVEVKKEYLWQKHWKNVDLFIIDDVFAKEHPKPWLRTTCFVILMSLLFALCHWIFS